jgi:hypothetical protein
MSKRHIVAACRNDMSRDRWGKARQRNKFPDLEQFVRRVAGCVVSMGATPFPLLT